MAFTDPSGDWVFAHQFSVTPGAEYPDAGATVEVWTQGPGVAAGVDFSQDHLRGLFMEMEVLGPLIDLAPDAVSSMDLVWAACRCPGPISDITRYGAYTVPALTTVRQPIEAMARLAVEIALRRAADPGAPPETHSLDPELVVRNSTASVASRKEVQRPH